MDDDAAVVDLGGCQRGYVAQPAPVDLDVLQDLVLHLDGLRLKIPYEEHHEVLEDIMVYGRRLGDIATLAPSKIDNSSIIVRIKTRSRIADEDRAKNQ